MKKQWHLPELILISENTIKAKHLPLHNEHYYTRHVPTGGGGSVVFNSNGNTFIGHPFGSYNS